MQGDAGPPSTQNAFDSGLVTTTNAFGQTSQTLTLGDGAQCVWDGDGGDGLWSTAANWQGDVAPQEGDTLIFDGAGSYHV